MKPLIALFTVCFLGIFNFCSANYSIQWLTNYEEAVNQSTSLNKPMLLFFTGTGWCQACSRLEEEVLHKKQFSDILGKQFIYVKVDFPRKEGYTQDAKTEAQNQQLLSKFGVRSFPTVLILDSQQQKIGTGGYRAGGPEAYANFLMKMVNDYIDYKQGMKQVSSQTPGAELKQLLEKAQALDFQKDAQKIIASGVQSDEKLYFQLKRYRQLAEEGRLQDQEALSLKQELLEADPANVQLVPYHLAIVEFEAHSKDREKENFTPEYAVSPLVAYLEKFGKQDKTNAWRLQMIISQVFLDNNKLALALRYAQSSYEAAPPTVQKEIATAIRNLQTQTQVH